MTKHFTEIGPWWIPAIVASEEEYDFIVEKQKDLTLTRTIGKIEYAHYLPYQIGAGEMTLFWKFHARKVA